MHRASDHEPSRGQIVRAFAIAPLAAPAGYASGLVLVTIARAVFGHDSFPSTGALGSLIALVAAVGTPIAYAAAILGGLPAYLALRHFGVLSRWWLVLAGAVIGTVAAILVAPQFRGELVSVPFPWWVGAVLGVLSAAWCWRWLVRDPR